MNILNITLLIIGVYILTVGILWSKRNWVNMMVKLIFIASGGYIAIYALYLSNILIVLNK